MATMLLTAPLPLRLGPVVTDCVTHLARRVRAYRRGRSLKALLAGQVCVAAAAILYDPVVTLTALAAATALVGVPAVLVRAWRGFVPVIGAALVLAATVLPTLPPERWSALLTLLGI